MKITLGRNEPCHCGSGKKYKQCHLAQDEQRIREARSLTTLGEWVQYHARQLGEPLLAEARGAEAVRSAAEGFFGGEGPEDPLGHAAFRQHALFDVPVGEDSLIARAEVDAQGESVAERTELRNLLAASHPTFLEVVESKRGKGVRLKDHVTGSEMFHWDAALAEQLEPMEVILARRVYFRERAQLLPGWEKLSFHGRKKAIAAVLADLAAAELPEGEGLPAARRQWAKRHAARLQAAAREAQAQGTPRYTRKVRPPVAADAQTSVAPTEEA